MRNATGQPKAERKLAAILAADVVGYSRLMGIDEEGTHARLKTIRRELIDPKIKEHHGRVVRLTGDGALVEFPSVVGAVRCAVDIQRGMINRNADEPEEKRIVFGIGINVGDIIVDGIDIYGDDVNVAARLETLCEPGGLCVSRAVNDQIRDKLSLAFADLGEQTVKNISRAVAVFGPTGKDIAALPEEPTINSSEATEAGPAKGMMGTTNVAPRLSIVVLPFMNLCSDPEQEYFADGITEHLTSLLSLIPRSFVIARNTAFTYKNQAVDARQIGRELGVRYLLEGSVQRSASQIRVNAQLIDAEMGCHLWVESFDRERGDIFAIEDEITNRVAHTLGLRLAGIEARRAERRGTSADAMDYVMRGEALWQRPPSKDNYRAVAEMYERALQLDDRLPAALSGMANVLAVRVLDQLSDIPEDDLRRAEELVSKALALDPNSWYTHLSKGQILRAHKRFDEAIVEYETVIALNPNTVYGRSHLARVKAAAQVALAEAVKRKPDLATIAGVRKHSVSNRPKFLELKERTLIEGLRKAGMPER
jgi:TolB-like protein/class 3 adenylate cyclase